MAHHHRNRRNKETTGVGKGGQKEMCHRREEDQVRRVHVAIGRIDRCDRELSNGHFSDENQKRLNGSSSSAIPIFEAKMQRDLRLVVRFFLW